MGGWAPFPSSQAVFLFLLGRVMVLHCMGVYFVVSTSSSLHILLVDLFNVSWME